MASAAELAIDLPVPAADAFDAVCRALSAAGFALPDADVLLGIVAARTSMDPAPEDGGFDVYVQPAAAGTSTVILRPALVTGPTGWGRGERLVAHLAASIRHQATLTHAHLPPPPPTA